MGETTATADDAIRFRLRAGSVRNLGIVQAVATMHGSPLPTAEQANWLLWTHTAWPVCGTEHAIAQLHDWFAGRFHCPRCGCSVPTDDLKLCAPCAVAVKAESEAYSAQEPGGGAPTREDGVPVAEVDPSQPAGGFVTPPPADVETDRL